MPPKRSNLNRNSARRGRRRGTRLVHSIISGTLTSPPLDPPMVTYNPWNTLTIVTAATTPVKGQFSYITTTQLFNALRFQLGLPEAYSDSLSIRLRSCSLWFSQAGSMRSLNVGVVFYGLVAAPTIDLQRSTPELAHCEEFASGVHPARVGFVWPLTHQSISIDSASTGVNVLGYVLNVDSVPLQAHFNVLWRLADSESVPTLRALRTFTL